MKDLVEKVIAEAELSNSSIHGVWHWRMVERNAHYLCQFNEADLKVVYLFALFHDCKRENDHRDLEHGPRAERYLRSIRDWVDLSDERFENLCLACATHTLGTKAKNVTVATCWDSDRLEIGRVGFIPDEKFMSTEEAKRIAREDDFEVLESFEYSGIIPEETS